jgi:hypothetical protein
MHALEICKHINHIIYNDINIKSKINDRIFQLISKSNTEKPYITTSRGNINSTVTKDKRIDNTVMVHIEIYALKY